MVSVFVGTRPEVVKLAPVVIALRIHGFEVTLVATGQQDDADTYLRDFGLKADVRLDHGIDRTATLAERTARMMSKAAEYLSWANPTSVVVQGDTATVFAVAMAAFLTPLPVVHVEAGLRTRDLDCPYPEEGFRQMVSRIAALNCAPTHQALTNLQDDNVPGENVMTGNTIVDGLRMCECKTAWPDGWKRGKRPVVLVTCHRRENWGKKATELAWVIRAMNQGVDFHVILHPNPEAQKPFLKLRGLPNVDLHPSIGYSQMLGVLMASSVIVTDSGGLVEEAATLGRPTVIFRDKTERMEAVEAGLARMAKNAEDVRTGVNHFLENQPAKGSDVFGDGHAAERVVRAMMTGELV